MKIEKMYVLTLTAEELSSIKSALEFANSEWAEAGNADYSVEKLVIQFGVYDPNG